MGNLKQQSIMVHNALMGITHYRPEMVTLTQPDGTEFDLATMLPDENGEYVREVDVVKRFNIECAMKDMREVERR